MALTLPNTSLGTGVVNPTALEENFTAIAAKFGSIDNSDISSSAAIGLGKLAGRYDHLLINLRIDASILNTAVAGTDADYMAFVPVPDDGDGAWALDSIRWVCKDTGDGLAQVSLHWGYWAAGPTWSNTATLATAQAISNSIANNNSSLTVSVSNMSVSGGFHRSIAIKRAVAGTGYGTAGGGGIGLGVDEFSVSLLLKRDISST